LSQYTKATNFTAKDGLPTGNSGKIVKGAEIDTELTAVASAISSKADLNSPALTGTPTAPTASAATNTTQLATTAFVQTALASAFTSGMIMMWSGTIATIPTGWVLCNGSNSTPDLRNRFVIGAHSDNTGVANTTVTGGSTLTGGTADAVVVSHTHTATSTDSGHTHTVPSGASGASTPTGPAPAASISGQTTATGTANITTTIASTGVSGTNQNLPPYYALAYIMKT
jgi:microcystin-dependent protein